MDASGSLRPPETPNGSLKPPETSWGLLAPPGVYIEQIAVEGATKAHPEAQPGAQPRGQKPNTPVKPYNELFFTTI